jgi:hypothetical protein
MAMVEPVDFYQVFGFYRWLTHDEENGAPVNGGPTYFVTLKLAG